MTARPPANAALRDLRREGDRALEEKLEWNDSDRLRYLKAVMKAGLTPPEGFGAGDLPAAAWEGAVEICEQAKNRFRLPTAALEETRRLFHRYGTEIGGALLLAGLPEAYAARWGARVLAVTGELDSNPRRRIRATAQFLVSVLGPVGDIEVAWSKDGGAFRAVVGLRLFHSAVRSILSEKAARDAGLEQALGPENTVAINQEDLVATRLTFSVGVFEVLDRFGISWSAHEQAAYLTAWRFIGACLGIQSKNDFDPETVAGARPLLDRLRAEQWTLPPRSDPATDLMDLWKDLEPGRTLVHALLDELTEAMPKPTRGWPLAVMRQLCPPPVGERLGLGASGLALSLLDQLPPLRTPTARFTSFSRPNPLKGRVLRLMANEVTRRTVVAFVLSDDPPPFVLPEFRRWTSGIRSR